MTASADFDAASQPLIEAAFEKEQMEDYHLENPSSNVNQLSGDMMTLSLVPRSRWQTLLHLDVIKVRLDDAISCTGHAH